jgi:RNA polymerase sigma-70 factor (ECF subfamily)
MAATSRLTNPDLIARAREGSPEALEDIYVKHGDALMRLAYHLTGSAADAEDVLHDVFLGLPEALARYQERGAFAAWLRRVTVRVALTRMRVARRRRELPLQTATEDPQPRLDDALANRVELERAVRNLPARLRTVFVLKEVEGLSHAEIGEVLGIRVGTSEVRLHRALKKLREDLGGAR